MIVLSNCRYNNVLSTCEKNLHDNYNKNEIFYMSLHFSNAQRGEDIKKRYSGQNNKGMNINVPTLQQF